MDGSALRGDREGVPAPRAGGDVPGGSQPVDGARAMARAVRAPGRGVDAPVVDLDLVALDDGGPPVALRVPGAERRHAEEDPGIVLQRGCPPVHLQEKVLELVLRPPEQPGPPVGLDDTGPHATEPAAAGDAPGRERLQRDRRPPLRGQARLALPGHEPGHRVDVLVVDVLELGPRPARRHGRRGPRRVRDDAHARSHREPEGRLVAHAPGLSQAGCRAPGAERQRRRGPALTTRPACSRGPPCSGGTRCAAGGPPRSAARRRAPRPR